MPHPEARSVPLGGICHQSELTHDESLSACLDERLIEPSVLVFEDPQSGDASGESLSATDVVLLGHPQQNDESRRYRAQLAPAGTYARPRDSLHNSSQRSNTRAS